MSRDLGKFVIGQEVWVKIIDGSNADRRYRGEDRNIENRIFQGNVTKVGRKYITVKFDEWKENQFSVEDEYRNKYTCGGADYQLYLTKQDILDEIECENIYSKIQRAMSSFKNNGEYSLEQLKKVKEILGLK